MNAVHWGSQLTVKKPCLFMDLWTRGGREREGRVVERYWVGVEKSDSAKVPSKEGSEWWQVDEECRYIYKHSW